MTFFHGLKIHLRIKWQQLTNNDEDVLQWRCNYSSPGFGGASKSASRRRSFWPGRVNGLPQYQQSILGFVVSGPEFVSYARAVLGFPPPDCSLKCEETPETPGPYSLGSAPFQLSQGSLGTFPLFPHFIFTFSLRSHSLFVFSRLKPRDYDMQPWRSSRK